MMQPLFPAEICAGVWLSHKKPQPTLALRLAGPWHVVQRYPKIHVEAPAENLGYPLGLKSNQRRQDRQLEAENETAIEKASD